MHENKTVQRHSRLGLLEESCRHDLVFWMSQRLLPPRCQVMPTNARAQRMRCGRKKKQCHLPCGVEMHMDFSAQLLQSDRIQDHMFDSDHKCVDNR